MTASSTRSIQYSHLHCAVHGGLLPAYMLYDLWGVPFSVL
uniref:Uncharacterized protein n=1 Tax=Anguilla anguilla TaxID=7936 RepID=A0A0E9Q7L6_ANGAN